MLIIVDVGTLGIDSAGLGMVVGIITGGGWRPDQLLSTGNAVQPPAGRRPPRTVGEVGSNRPT
jgi:hypothetical protein